MKNPRSQDGRRVIDELFEEGAILVEVRFPRMGTGSNFYLFEEPEEMHSLVSRLGKSVELYAAPVHDVEFPRTQKKFKVK